MDWFGTRTRYWLLLILLITGCFLFLQKVADFSVVRVELENFRSDHFKIYWTTEEGEHWSETNAKAVYVNASKRRYVMLLPVPPSEILKLRIDPNSNPRFTTEIREISFHNLYTKAVRIIGKRAFTQFTPNEHVGNLKVGDSLKFTSTGNDAWFVMDFPAPEAQPVPWLKFAQSVLFGLFLFSIIAYLPWLFEDLRWVPAGLLFAACAVLSMAITSNYNVHPDESVHFRNASYYAGHYIPAEVCSEESRFTYSVYGVSRLNNREIAYYVGGRYLQLVDFIPAPDYLKLRFFNTSLFFILALLAFRRPAARYLFLPLLLTPQAWYLFSYYNSDALSLFAVLIAAYQAFVPQSMVRRLLNGERPPGFVLWVFGLGILVAMQYWVKLNYLFYPLFLGMLAGSWWLLNLRIPSLRNTLPLIMALLIGTGFFLTWEVSRHATNDYALSGKVFDCQETLAQPAYKPSTPLEETHYNVRLKDKGYTINNLLVTRSWPERIYYTGLGTYGYTQYLNSYEVFEAASFLIVLFLLYTLIVISVRGDGMARMAVLSTLGVIVGVSGAAFWVNWTVDFQPQGRYLLVYLPVLGSLMAMYGGLLNRAVVSVLTGLAFLIAVYSFFAIGLVEISKT